jgi:uncharacterized membrane protein
MAPLHGIQKYLRGAAWLILLLAGTGAALTLRSVAASHPLWVAIVAGAVLVALQFGFFLVSPRLLLDLPFAWRDLIPGAAICTGAAIVVHTVSALFLRNWLGVYGHAYGGFGISLALAAFVGIIASFWVWIAAVMGVYWERKAGPAAVAKMEKLSADVSASSRDLGARRTSVYRQPPVSAIFCCASAMAPLRALTWWPSASPTALVRARVTAGSTLAAAECG